MSGGAGILSSPAGHRAGPVRVLFLAWGYSIHAERRIRVFSEDPRFEVALASGYPYDLPGVRRFALSQPWYSAGRLRRLAHAVLSRATPAFAAVHALVAAWDLVLLRRAVRTFRPDVVFLQTLLYPSYLGLLLPRRLPVAITFWNGDLTWYAKWDGLERLLKRRIVTWGLSRAAVITVNSATAETKALGLGAPRDRVHLVRYPGVDLARFTPAPAAEARAALGVAARHVVLWPRGLGGYLNSDVLVEASAAIVRACPEVLFLMLSGVGGDAERGRHIRRLAELGTADRFRWEGQIDWKLMPAYYRAADVMVSISSNDSLPNCMMEAMACGTPLVLGDIPPIREWVRDGENGLLVPPRDPGMLARRVVQVLSDPDGCATMVQRNLAIAREALSSEKNCVRVKELVAGLAALPASAAPL